MEQLIAAYGYWAVLIGTFLEGETILVLGGYAAHRGWLDLPLVILAAFGGSFGGDELYFLIGRRHGRAFLAKRPAWERKTERASLLLRRHQNAVIFGSRFLYGLRVVIPFAIGMSGVSPRRFVVLNFLGAAVWAVAFGLGGYCLGEAMERLLGDLQKYEHYALGALALAGLAVWCLHFVRQKRHRASS